MHSDEILTWMLVPKRLTRKIMQVVLDNPPKKRPGWAKQVSGAMSRKSKTRPTTLSEREMEVTKLIQQGFSNTKICTILELKYDTVKDHVCQIRLKLGLKSRKEIFEYTIE